MDGHELASLLICRGAQICVLNVNNQFCSDHRFCPTLSCAQLRVTAVLYPRDGVYAHVATCQANDGRNVSTDHGTFHIALDVHEAPDGIETGELRSTSAYNIATSIPARLEFERTPRLFRRQKPKSFRYSIASRRSQERFILCILSIFGRVSCKSAASFTVTVSPLTQSGQSEGDRRVDIIGFGESGFRCAEGGRM